MTAAKTEAARIYTALGLMSGTSLDGIDAALLETDGEGVARPGPADTYAYDAAFRAQLHAVLGGKGDVAAVEEELTVRHAAAVRRLLDRWGRAPATVDVIGFHGHTILHRPERGQTKQIGDGARLAADTGIDVVTDFRAADVAAGGEGAPFAPLYHAALAGGLPRPVVVLNLGGVANVTWIGADGTPPLAFDTGPGNALLDDWAGRHGGEPCDRDGRLARAGQADRAALEAMMRHPYFDRPPPKSLDRGAFDPRPLKGLSPADGAATLVAFTASAVAAAARHFPAPPRCWVVTGGGRRNPALMAALEAALAGDVRVAEAVRWDGDALEAQAFAYLAVRSLKGLALSLPTTTGVPRPTAGGRLFRAVSSREGTGST